jgi:hypothetical protein
MDELGRFIYDYTNADMVFSDSWRCEDDTILELKLNRYGFSWWAYRNVNRYPDFEWDEHFWVAAEENLKHPIISIQMAMQELRDVVKALQDIGVVIGGQSLYLDEVL